MKIGIDLGGSHIAVGVVNNNGEIVEKIEKRLTNKEKQDVNKSIIQYIEEYIETSVKNFETKYDITNIGMSIPGTVSESTIIKSVNLGFENYNIADSLKEKTGFSVKIKNDAKCAAIAENAIGCLKQYSRSIFITLGTGIGGAVIIDDKLLDTGNLPGCEFGHMVIEKDGILCNCNKRGCWEKYASMKNFKDKLRNELGLTQQTRGEELLNMIKNNRPQNANYEKIESVVADFIEYLALGIANLVNIFEPEAIGIGGSFIFFKEVFLERLKNKLLSENMLFNPREDLNIKTAVLGNDAGIIGATLI